ncbi:MAG: dipeptide epimerase [Cyclobacteriaceae bacterium]|nr:dipeptide epimerase [Cyclobacteriaceae bacterium]
MQIIFHPHNLRLRHTFAISRESYDVQPSLIVELKKDGHSGYGEATANPYYQITVENMMQTIENYRAFIEGLKWDEPTALWEAVADKFGKNTFALCALDEAAYDLWGKLQGKPVHSLWGLDPQKAPVSNYTIGIDTIEKMVEKLKEFPWPIYKIKLGTKDDLQIIRELRRHTGSVFRVDANCAWSASQTIALAPELKKLGVEFIEQPMRADAYEEMREVKKQSVLPLMADESCIVEKDVEKCADAFHGINIKLTKCGGLTPARRMISKARELNLKVMVGCMTESSVGISALAQLAPMLDYVDMDGAMLLAEDIAKGVVVHEKGLTFSDVPGNGTVLL